MSDYAAAILALLLDWQAKGFVVLGLALIADLLLRRTHASLRHQIWLGGMIAVMLLPVVAWMLPGLNMPLIHFSFLTPSLASGAESAQAGSREGFAWSASGILLGIYGAGLLLVLFWQLMGRAYVRRLRKRSAEVVQEKIVAEFHRLRAALGVRRPVRLLRSDLISFPFSTGYLHPVIVLPQSTVSWPPHVLESVLIHELAHIKRRDILARIAAQINCCVHWINPLAWYGLGRIMMEQEIACDGLVLVTGTKASDYARNLLTLSEMRHGRMDFALTALGRRTELKHRLMEILQPTRTRALLGDGGPVIVLSLTFGLLLPISALNLWNAPDARRVLITPASVSGQQSSQPRAIVPVPPAEASARPLPDIAKAKEEISKKIRDMKEQGVTQEEIDKFARQAKAKIEYLQMEKAKEAKAKQKQAEQMMLHEGKKST